QAAVGIDPELLRSHDAQHGADPLGDVISGLDAERLHVDDAGAELHVGRKLLRELDLGHAAVGELEDELTGLDVSDRGKEMTRGADGRKRTPVEIAEADVKRELRVDA